MSKLFNFLKPKGNPQTSGFDLSKANSFSFGAGMIQPVFYRYVMNKTRLNLSLPNAIVNTTPMVNQPFSRGKFYIDNYQVPMSQLWSDYNEFYAQAREIFSTQGQTYESVHDAVNFEYLPVFSLPFVVACCAHDIYTIKDSYVTTPGWTFGSPRDYVNAKSDLYLGFDVHGYPRALGTLRLLDMFGYGNYYLILKDIYLNNSSLTVAKLVEKVVEYLVVTYTGKEPSYDDTDLWTSLDFCSWLQGVSFDGDGEEISPFGLVEPFALLAYQKVFSDIYRNTFYDKSNPFSFNVDYWVENYDGRIGSNNYKDAASDMIDDAECQYQFWSIFELHYRQFKHDMFTSLLPDSQFGDVATVSVGDSDFRIVAPNKLSNDLEGTLKVVGDLYSAYPLGTVYSNDEVADTDVFKLKPLPSFSVLAQRRAEALQRYKERYLRAGNRLTDQFESMFGQVPKYLADKYCQYLGSMDSVLNNNPVPSTSDSGDYTVGERASYGTATVSGDIKFDCRDMSVLISLAYFLPEADYESFNIDPIHTRLHFLDVPQVEFENLGLSPVYRHALSVAGTSYADIDAGSVKNVYGNPVIGYAPPYLEWKTDVDRLHGEFGHTDNLNGVFSSWVTSRGNVSMRSLSDYYVDPAYLNSIMIAQFDGSQVFDPFLCFFNFDCKVVQPLTVTGLPIWN